MNYNDKFNSWFTNQLLNEEAKDELLDMSEEEKQAAFSGDLEFSTAGARAIMSLGSNRFNSYTVRKINYGFLHYLIKYNTKELKKGIVIGFDSRNNSERFAKECAAFFTNKGVKVYLFENITPTPEVSYTIIENDLVGGIMITASHNPKEYNGYKLYNKDGHQFSLDEVDLLVDELREIKLNSIFEDVEAINESNLVILDDKFDKKYFDKLDTLSINKDLDKSNFKIIYTPLHGSGLLGVSYLLEKNGYKFNLVKEQSKFDGDFKNTSSLNPEELEAFDLAIELAKEKKANLIIATDPDADRLGVCYLKEDEVRLFSGNELGALLIYYLLTNKQNLNNAKIITTVVTSSLGEKIATSFGVETIYTLTGFKFIGELMKKNNYENFLLGYEESAGFLLNNFTRDKDAISASLLVCEMALYYKNKNITLMEVLEMIYQKYGYHLNKTISTVYGGINGKEKMDNAIEKLRNLKTNRIKDLNIVAKEDYLLSVRYLENHEEELNLPKNNMLKFIFEDSSFIAIRPSGTEPKLRVYYNIFSSDKFGAEEKLESLKAAFEEMLLN